MTVPPRRGAAPVATRGARALPPAAARRSVRTSSRSSSRQGRAARRRFERPWAENQDESRQATPVTISAASTPTADENGRGDGSDADGGKPEHLDDAEDAGQHFIGNGALHQRQPGDVDERVPDSEQRRETRRTRRSWARPEHDERRPDSTTPSDEGRAEASCARSESARTAPMSAPTPDGRVQVSDAGLAEFRSSNAVTTMKTCTAPADEGLRREERDDHAQRRIPGDRREASEGLGRDRRRFEPAARGARLRRRGCSRTNTATTTRQRSHREHRSDVVDGKEDPRRQRGRRTRRCSRTCSQQRSRR